MSPSPGVTFRASDLRGLGASILVELGAPRDSAEVVADHVVTAHLMGLESHGVIRIAQYVRDIRNGRIQPAVSPVVLSSTPTLAVIDGCSGFGQLTATTATDVVVEKARTSGIATVTARRCNHVGRLGAYVERGARQGVVTIAVAAIPKVGQFVVPWGGIDGRLGTNPIAFGFPTSGDPIVADFATSVIPEGRIRTAKNKHVLLPVGAVLDAEGNATRDPDAFYGPPMGTILPFGGIVGHKGYALALLVELLGATLAGDLPEDDTRSINGLTIIGIDSGAFGRSPAVDDAADSLVEYLRSSRSAPGAAAVMVPGEPEFTALRDAGADPSISLDPETWKQIEDIARSLEVPLPTSAADPEAGR
jgi:uncharacterized oxidoreductase